MKHIKRQNFTLVELLIYIATFSVISTVAYKTFSVGHHNSNNIIRITEDILRISQIGDIWRKEFEKADKIEVKENKMILSYKDSSSITYSHKDSKLLKSIGDKANKILASNVKSIEFNKLETLKVLAYEMNIELNVTKNKLNKLCPLFSFIGIKRGLNE